MWELINKSGNWLPEIPVSLRENKLWRLMESVGKKLPIVSENNVVSNFIGGSLLLIVAPVLMVVFWNTLFSILFWSIASVLLGSGFVCSSVRTYWFLRRENKLEWEAQELARNETDKRMTQDDSL